MIGGGSKKILKKCKKIEKLRKNELLGDFARKTAANRLKSSEIGFYKPRIPWYTYATSHPQHTPQERSNTVERIVNWLIGCGYTEAEAKKEANIMIEYNRRDGDELCSREYAIEMILADIED